MGFTWGLPILFASDDVYQQLANKTHTANGHFTHFGPDSYDWIYCNSDKSLVARLTGLNDKGNTTWEIINTPSEKQLSSIITTDDNSKITFGSQIDLPGLDGVTAKRIAGKTYTITGYFLHYGLDAYDWVYFTPTVSVLAKLTGMNQSGNLTWDILDKENFSNINFDRKSLEIEFGNVMSSTSSSSSTVSNNTSEIWSVEYRCYGSSYISEITFYPSSNDSFANGCQDKSQIKGNGENSTGSLVSATIYNQNCQSNSIQFTQNFYTGYNQETFEWTGTFASPLSLNDDGTLQSTWSSFNLQNNVNNRCNGKAEARITIAPTQTNSSVSNVQSSSQANSSVSSIQSLSSVSSVFQANCNICLEIHPQPAWCETECQSSSSLSSSSLNSFSSHSSSSSAISNKIVKEGWRYPRGNMQNSGDDVASYISTSGEFELIAEETRSLTTANTLFTRTGDVTGNGVNELVVLTGKGIDIYNSARLDLVRTIPVNANASYMILEDVDSDGKMEILVGSRSSSSMNIVIYKADGTIYRTLNRSGGYDSTMMPGAYLGDGKLAVAYTTGYARDPRGYSVWDIAKTTPTELWYYDIGPSVGDMSVADAVAGGGYEMITRVGTPHNGASGTGNNGNGTATTDGDLSSILVNQNGQEVFTVKMGSDTSGGANGGSQNILTDLNNDGTYELISTVGHYKSYPGDAQIRVLEVDGSERHRVSVGNNANPQVIISDINNDGIKEIIASNYTEKKLLIYDQSLTLLASYDNAGDYVWLASDTNGNNYKEIFVRNGNQYNIYSYAGNFNTMSKSSISTSSKVSVYGTLVSDITGDNVPEIVLSDDSGKLYVYGVNTSSISLPNTNYITKQAVSGAKELLRNSLVNETDNEITVKDNYTDALNSVGEPLLIGDEFKGMITSVSQKNSDEVIYYTKKADTFSDVFDDLSIHIGRTEVLNKTNNASKRINNNVGIYDSFNKSPLNVVVYKKAVLNTRGLNDKHTFLRIEFPDGYKIPLDVKPNTRGTIDLTTTLSKYGITFTTAGSYIEYDLDIALDYAIKDKAFQWMTVTPYSEVSSNLKFSIYGNYNTKYESDPIKIASLPEISIPIGYGFYLVLDLEPGIIVGANGSIDGSIEAEAGTMRRGEIEVKYDVIDGLSATPSVTNSTWGPTLDIKLNATANVYGIPYLQISPLLSAAKVWEVLGIGDIRLGIKINDHLEGQIEYQRALSTSASIRIEASAVSDYKADIAFSGIDVYSTNDFKTLYESDPILLWEYTSSSSSSSSSTAVITYSWVTGSWGTCSGACGTNNATQSRTVSCKSSSGSSVSSSYCSASTKPVSSRSCTASQCSTPVITYSWVTGSWGTCSGPCGTNNATQSRTVTCKSSTGSNVSDSYCSVTTEPATTQSCTASQCISSPIDQNNYTKSDIQSIVISGPTKVCENSVHNYETKYTLKNGISFVNNSSTYKFGYFDNMTLVNGKATFNELNSRNVGYYDTTQIYDSKHIGNIITVTIVDSTSDLGKSMGCKGTH